jgi:hypothetical protein
LGKCKQRFGAKTPLKNSELVQKCKKKSLFEAQKKRIHAYLQKTANFFFFLFFSFLLRLTQGARGSTLRYPTLPYFTLRYLTLQ